MGRTLDTLIAAARAELDPQHTTSDAQAGVRGATAACDSLAAAHGIDTTVDTPGELLLVAGEQALVERTLAPVLENAYRHATSTVHITVTRSDGVIRFTIDDDGPGIPADELDAIFEPGRRRQHAGSPSSNGAGLGLALSRRLARSAGGDVKAEPSDNGARFIVRLPAA
jgi:signal transduction histidine kinase